jgi:hypothetical protein
MCCTRGVATNTASAIAITCLKAVTGRGLTGILDILVDERDAGQIEHVDRIPCCPSNGSRDAPGAATRTQARGAGGGGA